MDTGQGNQLFSSQGSLPDAEDLELSEALDHDDLGFRRTEPSIFDEIDEFLNSAGEPPFGHCGSLASSHFRGVFLSSSQKPVQSTVTDSDSNHLHTTASGSPMSQDSAQTQADPRLLDYLYSDNLQAAQPGSEVAQQQPEKLHRPGNVGSNAAPEAQGHRQHGQTGFSKKLAALAKSKASKQAASYPRAGTAQGAADTAVAGSATADASSHERRHKRIAAAAVASGFKAGTKLWSPYDNMPKKPRSPRAAMQAARAQPAAPVGVQLQQGQHQQAGDQQLQLDHAEQQLDGQGLGNDIEEPVQLLFQPQPHFESLGQLIQPLLLHTKDEAKQQHTQAEANVQSMQPLAQPTTAVQQQHTEADNILQDVQPALYCTGAVQQQQHTETDSIVQGVQPLPTQTETVQEQQQQPQVGSSEQSVHPLPRVTEAVQQQQQQQSQADSSGQDVQHLTEIMPKKKRKATAEPDDADWLPKRAHQQSVVHTRQELTASSSQEISLEQQSPHMASQAPFMTQQGVPLEQQGSSMGEQAPLLAQQGPLSGQQGTPSLQEARLIPPHAPTGQPMQTRQVQRGPYTLGGGSVVREGSLVMAKACGFKKFWPAKVLNMQVEEPCPEVKEQLDKQHAKLCRSKEAVVAVHFMSNNTWGYAPMVNVRNMKADEPTRGLDKSLVNAIVKAKSLLQPQQQQKQRQA